jgi:protein-S-isoprenylcysteine O-methyltransferase Ste14
MMERLPTILIGVIVLVYWGRVLRMAQKSRKICGHSANFIPGEIVGKLTRVIWIPVTALWIALPFVTALGHPNQWWLRPLFSFAPLNWMALALAMVALRGSWICWKIMGRSWRMGIDPNDKTALVTSGLYSLVRHPIYALSSQLMVCTAIACASPLMILVAALHILLLLFESVREEAFLVRLHGQAYEQYRQHTGRFIPRFGKPGAFVESR